MNNKDLPKNKEQFKKLIPFAQRIIKICKDNDLIPVIYGSYSMFHHTKDSSIVVNDIDMIVPKKDFPKITKILKKENIKHTYIREYPDNKMSTITIEENGLKVELDETGKDYATINEQNILDASEEIDFFGIKLRIVSIEQLADIYQTAYHRSKEDKPKIQKKIKHLEKFLGKSLL